MVDNLCPAHRSKQMSLIRGRHTKPELVVRSLVHALGYRFRLHRTHLPGQPDLVFPSRRKVIFVHGCFWHQHTGCRLARMPKSRLDYWEPKLRGNCVRDAENQVKLVGQGWGVFVIWECETNDVNRVSASIVSFLDEG
jgi:DNA mismatch endonuclease (patch repair protein)